MRLSPLRRASALLPLMLVACKDQPVYRDPAKAPSPPAGTPAIVDEKAREPLPGLNDAEIAAFKARAGLSDDLVINFGEPFIGFETRGNSVLVSDFTAGQRFAYVTAMERSGRGDETLLAIPLQSPWGEPEPGLWRISVKEKRCDDEFSGEITDFTAWTESGGRNYKLRGCARVVGAARRGHGA